MADAEAAPAAADPKSKPASAKSRPESSKVDKAAEAKELAYAEEEKVRALEREKQRWGDCLECLKYSVPRLRENPWLMIMEPQFIHDYLDSLTETLGNLSHHEDDLDEVRVVLQDVYEGFVDLGKFAKTQPAFYTSQPNTVKRFVRLLEQVAHRGSDKALFPNVLCLLSPSFDRPELHELLASVHIVNSLMSFARTDWMPTNATLALLLGIYRKLSVSPTLRAMFMKDPGWEKLCAMAYGRAEGFTPEQQVAAKHALELFPKQAEDEEAS